MRSPTEIEDELRAAFRAAADDVHPASRPLPTEHAGRRRPTAHRWLVPAVAAAAVAAITVPLLAATVLRGVSGPDIVAASTVTTSAGRATVAGVSFPVPSGWQAKTVGHTETAVTVCVAAQPSGSCDGVTLRIAVPDGAGAITPVRDPLTTDESAHRPATPGEYGSADTAVPTGDAVTTTVFSQSPGQSPSSVAPVPEIVATGPGAVGLPGNGRAGSTAGAPASAGSSAGSGGATGTAGTAVPVATTPAKDDFATSTCPLILDRDPIDSRPAVHYSIGYCAPGSAQSADWYILDGSLAVSTPRGVANEQAAQLVEGLDLSGYRHAFGPQIAFFSEPGEASSSAASPPTR